MANENAGAYALSLLCPIAEGSERDRSYAALTKAWLQDLGVHEESPFARVPNTYLCRLFVLDDVIYEGAPHALDHLKSKYLVATFNFHGERDAYLRGLWEGVREQLLQAFKYCVGFENVKTRDAFVEYIGRCQVPTTFFFNGSNGDPLAKQLKALYLKQELGRFAAEHQGMAPGELQRAFQEFVARTKPHDLTGPTWKAGASRLEGVVVGASPDA